MRVYRPEWVKETLDEFEHTQEASFAGSDRRAASRGRGALGFGVVGRAGLSEAVGERADVLPLAQRVGGMKADGAKRLKVLEEENRRLKKAVAELTLDKQILKEANEFLRNG